MFERFTDRARRALVEGQAESVEGQHGFLGTEHILLGLMRIGAGVAHDELRAAGVDLGPLREKVLARLAEWVDPKAATVSEEQALAAIGIDLGSVTSSIEAAFGPGALPKPGGAPPFTPKAKESLERALRHALIARQRYIGTEHLLLGLLDGRDGVAVLALLDLGVDIESLRTSVRTTTAPAEARLDAAWHEINELRRHTSTLPQEQQDKAKPALQQLAQALGQALGWEQAEVTRISNETAAQLEAALEAAQQAMTRLDEGAG